MQRRQLLTALGGLSLSPLVLARFAFRSASPDLAKPTIESVVHDLPRSAEAIYDLTQGALIYPTTHIQFIAQPYVEYAPRWPVQIVNAIPNVRWMALVIEQNPQPLAALFHFLPGSLTEASAYLKVADSTQVTVVVAAGDRFYGLQRFISVVGNCM